MLFLGSGTLALLLALVIALFIIVFFYGDRLKEMALAEVNAYLLAPVEVDAARVTLWPHFPRIALDLRGVRTSGLNPENVGGKALEAKHIYLIFNPLDVIRGDIRLRRIVAEDGKLNLIVFPNGEDNYHVFRSREESDTSGMALTLDRVELRNIALSYQDHRDSSLYRIFVHRLRASGQLDEEAFHADARGRIDLLSLGTENKAFLRDLPLEFGASISLDLASGNFIWKEGRVNLEGMELLSEGRVIPGERWNTLSLAAAAERVEWESLVPYLPEEMQEEMAKYDPEGVFSFDLKVDGQAGDGRLPRITGNWTLASGRLRLCEGRDGWLSDLSAEGGYDSGESSDYSKQQLEVKTFQATLNDMPLRGHLTVGRFGQPLVRGEVVGEIRYLGLPECWVRDAGLELDGQLALRLGFAYDHALWDSLHWSRALDLKGSGAFSEASYTDAITGIRLSGATGSLLLSQGNLRIMDVEGTSPQGRISGSLTLNGLLAFIEDASQGMDMVMDMEAESLPLAEWIESAGEDPDEGDGSLFPEEFSLDINLHIGKIEYKTFNAKDIRGNLSMNAGRLYARNLRMNTMEGSLGLQGVLEPSGQGYQLRCMARMERINVSEMFRQMDDFGQQDLTHKNISGLLNAAIDLSMALGNDLLPSPASLLAIADLSFEQGVVANYPPLKELSRFIRAGNLERVNIGPLKNRITIRDQKVYIPQMAVTSDAMDLVVSGVHGFDQRLDYSIQVLLSELLGRKAREAKKENEEFGWVEDDGLGRTTLFIRISGTMDSPSFSYDRREVARKIGEDLKTEGRELGKTLKEEFHWLGRDSLKRAQKKESRERLKRQENGEFILEWDSAGDPEEE